MIADEAAVAGEPGDLLILGHNVHLECDHTGRVYMLCPGCGRFVPHAVATPEDDKPARFLGRKSKMYARKKVVSDR